MQNLITRAVSAIIMVLVVLGLFFFLDVTGLKVLVSIAVTISTFELIYILHKDTDSKLARTIFTLSILIIFFGSSFFSKIAMPLFAFTVVSFCVISLLTQRKFEDLKELNAYQSSSILGFFYIGLLPSFVMLILDLPQGVIWFTTLLCTVFFGDIFAYLFGISLGKHKLMPAVSPKKSIEGAIGGFLGSIIAGLIMVQWLPKVHILEIVILSLAAGLFGQFGDLFESLLKRVADVKDSGKILPGHGGILDRIDGILFAAPVIYIGAQLLS